MALHFRHSLIRFASRSFSRRLAKSEIESSTFPCLQVAVSYKPGWIFAQLPLPVPLYHLCRCILQLYPSFMRAHLDLCMTEVLALDRLYYTKLALRQRARFATTNV
jgi:hypothetical protein